MSPNSSRSLPCLERVDRLLIDKNCIDDATHLDQLLPIPALLRAKRETSRAQTAPTLREADLGHHPFETGALHATPAAERPRSSSITSISAKPSAVRRSRMAYCNAPLVAVVGNTW